MSEIAIYDYPLAFKSPGWRGSAGTISVKLPVDVNGWPMYRMVKTRPESAKTDSTLALEIGVF